METSFCLSRSLTCRRRKILESEFTKVPSNYVRLLLLRGNPLYEVYSTLEASERSYPITGNPAYRRMKKERKTINDSELFILLPSAGPEREQLRDELSFAREKCRKENGNLSNIEPPY